MGSRGRSNTSLYLQYVAVGFSGEGLDSVLFDMDSLIFDFTYDTLGNLINEYDTRYNFN